MAQRMHYSEAAGGPMPCKATVGNCPLTELGEDGRPGPAFHSSDPKEMEAHIAKKMGGPFQKTASKLERETNATEEYTEPRAALSLKAGDRLTLGRTVVAVTKNKSGSAGKVTLKNSQGLAEVLSVGGNAKLPKDYKLPVVATRPTREAALARAELRIRESVARNEEAVVERIATLQAEMAENFPAFTSNSFRMSESVTASTTARLFAELKSRAADAEEQGERYPFATAAQSMRESAVRVVVDYARRGGSHSTSAVSNAIESVEMGVKAEVLRSLGVEWDLASFTHEEQSKRR